MDEQGSGSPWTLVVERYDGSDASWDTYVERTKDSTFCHVAAWRRVMASGLGHESLYLVARDPAGEWRGVLPLVRVRSVLFGHYLVSMPFLNYGGPIGEPEAQTALADAARSEAARSRADLLELRARHAVPSTLARVHRKVTVVLDLPESSEALWSTTIPAKRRRQIRRPQKLGMEPRFGAEYLSGFYEVFRRNMRDLGTPVLPSRFFEEVVDAMASRVVVGVVVAQGRPLAAGLGFVWGDEFELTWVSSIREFDGQTPNMLLYWAFMENALARGLRTFNFGRSTPGGGTHQFKRQWGGRDVPLPWLQWSGRGLTAPPTPDRPLYRVATRVWRRLPLAVTDRLGPPLSRGIP